MARLPRLVMTRMSSMPAWAASSTTYWMDGLSATGSISLGCGFVAGKLRVPSPAAGITALRTVLTAKRYRPADPLRDRAPRRGTDGADWAGAARALRARAPK